MIVRVYKSKAESEEKIIRLELVEGGSLVVLRAVDESGRSIPGGNILTISGKGTLHRAAGVTSELGLKLDDLGRIIENESYGGLE